MLFHRLNDPRIVYAFKPAGKDWRFLLGRIYPQDFDDLRDVFIELRGGQIWPVFRHADLMWFHERMRAGQELFELGGVDGETLDVLPGRRQTSRKYEIALYQRGSVNLGLLAIWFKRMDRTEARVDYFKRREDDDYQFVRRETYGELLADEFLNLMAELNDQEFLKV